MEEVYIVSGVRTAIGKYGGSLKSVPAHTLAAAVIGEAVGRSGVESERIDEVILGEVRQSTEASNIARCALLEAGLPESVPGFTVNRLCASAMQAVYSGCQEIWLGEADCIVAGGTENLSRAPVFIRNGRWGDGPMTLVDSNIEAGTTAQPLSVYGSGLSMPKTAENVAERFGISRDEQDRFSAESQRRAAAAIEAGYFKEEIVPVEVKERKNTFLFDTDEFPKPATTAEVLAKLKPIVKPDGTVTAGNSCGLNDGAACLVLMSGRMVKETGAKPIARIAGITSAALDPAIMGYGPVKATEKLLKKLGMTVSQIDLTELNEAFASQSVACIRDLGLNPEKVNVNGGAIALGHPLGCTGARLLVTLIHNLKRTGGRTGLATLCIGGGQSMAAVVEMV
ncbi:thiolase family protein [[Clostridium] symbiosum]|uniref:thiolase family protein n=1 Tax=Clostridium symbiosum TaxID=1512 RepID=UPI001D09170F|nr:thiolase family protein [[Clostridium] symbiosum]MCB6609159.1 thiolase family protein [[Clostridium] symbiosum]MCB6933367.1 thiolase family protein [[Clostridium] symbiosum]